MGKQGELAVRLSALTKIDIGQPAVSRWTSGSRPSMEHLAALADLAGVDAGWLAVGALSEAPVPESYITPPTVKRTGQRKPPPGGGAEQKRA